MKVLADNRKKMITVLLLAIMTMFMAAMPLRTQAAGKTTKYYFDPSLTCTFKKSGNKLTIRTKDIITRYGTTFHGRIGKKNSMSGPKSKTFKLAGNCKWQARFIHRLTGKSHTRSSSYEEIKGVIKSDYDWMVRMREVPYNVFDSYVVVKNGKVVKVVLCYPS